MSGFEYVFPAMPSAREARSGNTCFACRDGRALVNRLEERDVLCWGDFGRVRVSTHLYNSGDDVTLVMTVTQVYVSLTSAERLTRHLNHLANKPQQTTSTLFSLMYRPLTIAQRTIFTTGKSVDVTQEPRAHYVLPYFNMGECKAL